MFRGFLTVVSAVSVLSFALLPSLTCPAQTAMSSTPTGSVTAPRSDPSAASANASSVESPVAERLDTLGLDGSHLEASEPLVGEKSEFPEFTREFLRVQWRRGDPVDLFVIKPAKMRKPPVALFLYGYPTDTGRFRNNDYCKTVTKDGFAVVGFVSALTGHRYHDRPMKQWFVSELQESLVLSVHDVQMVLNYLASRGDLDMEHVGMFGQGSGGTIAILAAGSDSRLKAVDVLDPWGDWQDWMQHSPVVPEEERPQLLTPAFQTNVANLDPVKWLPKLSDRALRLQDTAFDTATPKESKSRMKAVLPPNAKYVRYESRESYKEHAASGGQILSWLSSQLTTDKNGVSQSAQGTIH